MLMLMMRSDDSGDDSSDDGAADDVGVDALMLVLGQFCWRTQAVLSFAWVDDAGAGDGSGFDADDAGCGFHDKAGFDADDVYWL